MDNRRVAADGTILRDGAMTNQDLIDRLQEFPRDALVLMEGEYRLYQDYVGYNSREDVVEIG